MVQTAETAAAVAYGGSAIPGVGTGDREQHTAIVQPGLSMTTDHWYTFNGQGPVPSVTRILDVALSKPYLVEWGKWTVAEFAAKHSEELTDRVYRDGIDNAKAWLASLPDQQKNAAARIGSSVHLLANMVGASEKAVEGFQIAEGIQPYLDAFRGFLARYSASNIVSSEKAVWNGAVGYAGTYDLLMLLPCDECRGRTDAMVADCADKELWLLDIKTGKGPKLTKKTEVTGAFYPEAALQLAAYANAESIILPNDPTAYKMPAIQRHGVLHLRPDKYPDTGYRLIPYTVGYREFIAFISAWDLYQWRHEQSM